MKIEKYICDICGKELNQEEMHRRGVTLEMRYYEVCEECESKLENIVNEYEKKYDELSKEYHEKIKEISKEG